jgi:hypothetical protein
VLLFVIYLAEIGYLAQKYGGDQFADEFNIRGFLAAPALTLYEGLILRFKPVNMDVLPLYIVLMGLFPPVLMAMLKRPNAVLVGSAVLYLLAHAFGWNLPAYPVGHWYFNPFAWQFMFVFGAWFALGGSVESTPFIRSQLFLLLGSAYLIFALVVTLAGPFPELRSFIPEGVYSLFSPNDKTNLAWYRIIHFAVIAFFVVRLVPRDWKGLESPLFAPAIVCGQQSLEVFCVGIFLSFAAHFVLVEVSGALPMQILVSVVGIGAMTGLAYYRSWSKRMDKKPAPANPPKAAPTSV